MVSTAPWPPDEMICVPPFMVSTLPSMQVREAICVPPDIRLILPEPPDRMNCVPPHISCTKPKPPDEMVWV